MDEWEIRVTNEFLTWFDTLDDKPGAQVVDAIDRLAEDGPGLGRPLVDRLEGRWSTISKNCGRGRRAARSSG